ncbi:laminin subunit alpha-2 [Caerostris extrusa]|uniref:Laminin subunit alpha-2 n=1 Tax=Caerostris extrusa TaxID=172846 RepID=A0AAV4TKG2_CAEEX|nr:laminin subunit alpha-2 [Caerostris extrusa]
MPSVPFLEEEPKVRLHLWITYTGRMRLVLLLCFLGFAAADFLQKADSAVDENVLGFLQGAVRAGSLSRALGLNDPEVDQIGDDLETELGRTIREALKEFLAKLKDHVENGKIVGRELVEKVKEMRNKLKELGKEEGDKAREVLQKIREKAREALRKILERLGLGKRNLDDSMDQVARMKFREIVEKIREKLMSNETIQKIREYIRNHYGDSKVVKKLKEWIEKLRDSELREIVDLLFPLEHNSLQMRGETWDKLKNFFKDLNIKIQEHSKKFGQWVKDMWGKGLDKMKDKYGTIKAIAMEFIANSKDMSAEMSREALEFFRPYKDDLGTLWNKLVDATKEAIGKF